MDGEARPVTFTALAGVAPNVVLPSMELVAHKIRLLGNVVDIAAPAADGNLRGRVYFQVLDAKRADAVIDGIADLLRARVPALVTQAAPDAGALKVELDRELNARGVLVTRVQLG